MKKRKKVVKKIAKKKVIARPVLNVKRVMAFFSLPKIDEEIQKLTRQVLREIPCVSCGKLVKQKVTKASVLPKAVVEKIQEQLPNSVFLDKTGSAEQFDPSVYADALSLARRAVKNAPDVLRLRTAPAPSSHHLLSLAPVEDASLQNKKPRASFFRPGELPELRSLSQRTSAEFLLPAFEQRFKLHGKLPAGFVGLGKEIAGGALEAVEQISEPMRKAVGHLPHAIGVHDTEEDVLPVFPGELPRRMGWASGVPKNLPVVEEVSFVHAAVPELTFAHEQSQSSVLLAHEDTHLTLIERWGHVHEHIMTALKAPGHPLAAAFQFAMLAGVVVFAPLGTASLAAKGGFVREVLVSAGTRGVNALFSGGQAVAAKDPSGAAQDFASASVSFHEAKTSLDKSSGALQVIIGALPGVGDAVHAGQDLLNAAHAISDAGSALSNSLADGGTIIDRLSILTDATKHAIPSLALADDHLSRVNSVLIPDQYRDTFATLKQQVHEAYTALASAPDRLTLLSEMLGKSGMKRYLIVFQNSNELRATGGFIGSIAEATFDNGELKDLRVPEGGSYDLQGELRVAFVPPAPLLRVSGKWGFHDANWFADFPTTAQKLSWFYQKAGGPSVDGVIAINSEILPKLLEVTGPISMPTYHRTITADNVITETQFAVEADYDKTANTPKKFIGDLLKEIMTRLQKLPMEKMLTSGAVLEQALHEKTIQVSFFDDSMQQVADAALWTGQLAKTDADTLRVVDTNIGGGKTDGVIAKVARVEVAVSEDGSLTHTVTLDYSHNGKPSDPFTGVTYRDYLRLYVPEGSELVSVTGDFHVPATSEFQVIDPTFGEDPQIASTIGSAASLQNNTDVWSESGRTVFGHWLTILPGDRMVVRFTYRGGAKAITAPASKIASLAGARTAAYKFLLEKQPGSKLEATVSVTSPETWKQVWQSADALVDQNSPTALSVDRYYAIVYQP